MSSPTNIEGNALIHNERGDIVAIVTDINNNDELQETNDTDLPTNNTDPNVSTIPPLIVQPTCEDKQIAQNTQDTENTNSAVKSNEQNENVNSNNSESANMNVNSEAPKQSRWNKENRIVLKQLMGSLPPHDIGAALRVILDTFGVESSKLVRRGDFIELDLIAINDDYILDSLWNYCAQMQYNIMSSLQMQQQQQQQLHYQQMQQIHHIPPQHAVPVQMMQHQYIPNQTQLQHQVSPQVQNHNIPQLSMDTQNIHHNRNHNIQ